jgi:hypothetical protein
VVSLACLDTISTQCYLPDLFLNLAAKQPLWVALGGQ